MLSGTIEARRIATTTVHLPPHLSRDNSFENAHPLTTNSKGTAEKKIQKEQHYAQEDPLSTVHHNWHVVAIIRVILVIIKICPKTGEPKLTMFR